MTIGDDVGILGYRANPVTGSLTSTTFSYKGHRAVITDITRETLEGETELFLLIPGFFGGADILSNWSFHVGSSVFTGSSGTDTANGKGRKWSNPPTFTIGETVTVKLTTTEPGRPTLRTADDVDPNGPVVSMVWSAPASPGASAITGYQYRRGGLEHGTYDGWTSIPGGGSITFHEVHMPYAWPDGSYPFQMRAVNSVGPGLWSNVHTAEVEDERAGLQVSDTSAHEGYRNTDGGRARQLNDANMLKFDITVDPPLVGQWMEVRVRSRDGTATGGEAAAHGGGSQDYSHRILVPRSTPDPNEQLSEWEHVTRVRFTEGVGEKSVYVRVIDDLIEDSGETMFLDAHITKVGGLEWHQRPPPTKTTGTGTIYNDEEVGQNSRASVAGGEVREGDGELDFTITLSEPVSADVSVKYKTRDGSASSGSDYTHTEGWAYFRGGETSQTISVPIVDDDVDESKQKFTLALISFNNVGMGSPLSADGWIVDDDTTALTAAFENMPAEHDGDDFTFRLRFNQNVATRYAVMRDDVFDVTGGEIDDARRVNKRHDLWQLTVEPDSEDEDVIITLPETTSCGATGAVCSRTNQGKTAEPLSHSLTATVRKPPPDPVTATFTDVPDEHDGTWFEFELGFNKNVKAGYRRIRDRAFSVTGGKVTKATRKTQGSNQHWTVRVKPDGNGDVTVTLPETTDCDDAGAICTDKGGKLNHSTTVTVLGPVGISIGDAEVDENAGAPLAFAVALSRAASSSLTIDYATSDGTATAGADYTAASGTLTIAEGESGGTIEVAVIDDDHDEGNETLTLTLSNASSGDITDASATGTIKNQDALPKALLARFGRTAAVHIVEQVEERVNAPRAPGFDGRVAGRQINRDMGRDFAVDFVRQLGGGAGYMPNGGQRFSPSTGGSTSQARVGNGTMASSLGIEPTTQPAMNNERMQGMHPQGVYNGGMGMGVGSGRLLDGSSFALNQATAGGVLSFWSRSAQSSFYGQDGALALNGDVRSTIFGADYAKDRMVTGVSLAHSRGLGSYAGVDSGRMSSAVTGLYPWIGYKASEGVTVWTVAGYGAGGLMLNPGAGAPIETGLSMAMAAGGGRGELVTGKNGFALAFKADALWVGTRTDAASGPGGNLDSTRSGGTRLRTALEGSQSMRIANRMALTPSMEIGIRQDGGDAETGRGIDLGAGLVLGDGVSGLAVDIRVRRLLVHEAEGFAENSMSVSVSYNPTPSTPLGFSARVSPAWGGDAMSGADALWGRETMSGTGGNHLLGTGGNRLDTEVGYGLPIGTRFVGTPRLGVRTSDYGRDYRIGYAMSALEQGALNLQLGIDAERRESPVFHHQQQKHAGADQRVIGRASFDW